MPVGMEADAAGTTEAFVGDSTARARQVMVSLSSSSLEAASIVKPRKQGAGVNCMDEQTSCRAAL
eukprot:scaffold395479_cov31-Attheya_sp.AAC.2